MPVSFRLMPDERLRLERNAAGMSISSYLRWLISDPASRPPPRRGQVPVKDHQALSAALAKIGASRIANNLNQLVKAAHSGSLVLTPEIEAELRQAIADIASMRALLIDALGLSDAQ